MKKYSILFVFSALAFSLSLRAQCTMAASGFGNNTTTPTYNVAGGVELVLNANNTITLNLASNFTTATGPDVRAYLINPETRTTAMIKALNGTTFPAVPKILFGMVASTNASPPISPNGAKTFTVAVPAGITIGNYTKIFFYCQQFNVFWDFGTITGFTPANCAVLALDEVAENSFSVFPNPVSNDLSLNIYSAIGSLVYTKNNISASDNTVNVASLNQGVYIVALKDSNNKTFTKRFVKVN
jgi:hypothetical protein